HRHRCRARSRARRGDAREDGRDLSALYRFPRRLEVVVRAIAHGRGSAQTRARPARFSRKVSDLPAGFKPLFRSSPVIDLIGPVYSKGEGGGLVLGMRAENKHCNMRGGMHGGILATLADVALGYTMAFSTTPPT